MKAILLMSLLVLTHDWFVGKIDPKSGARCCGGADCAVIPAELFNNGAITETSEGYHIVLTLEQTRLFNKAAPHAVKGDVPWPRVQPSETGGYAMCIWRDEVKCFFAPQNT